MDAGAHGETKRVGSAAAAAAVASTDPSSGLNVDIPTHDYDLPTSAKVFSIQTVLRDTLDKLDIVANLTAPKDSKAAIEAVMSSLSERRGIENSFLATVGQRTLGGASIRAQQANAASMRDTLGAFRTVSKKVSQQLSSESASSAHLFATRLRKEKMRLLATFLRAARELKSLGNCPTLFQTVQAEKNRESRLENTVRFIAALRDNIQRLEKAIVVEHEARTREEHAAKDQLQALKDQLREMKTELQVAQRFEEAGSKACINTIRRAHAQEEARLARHIAELNEQADREDKAFKLSDEFLLRKQGRAEEQLAAWNGKAEREIKELTERLERLTQDREKTITDLRAAEDVFKRETAEKEARLDRERRRVAAEEHFRKCVVIVQKMIRGYLARKRVAKLIKERKAEKKKAAAAAKGDKKKK